MISGYSGLLTATVFLPAAGALAILLVGRGDRFIRWFAVLVTLADLVSALWLFVAFDRADGAQRFQFIDRFPWIPGENLQASFFLGLDGLSVPWWP